MCRTGGDLPADPRQRHFGNKEMMHENTRSPTAPRKKCENIQNKKTRSYHGFWDEKAVCCMDASTSTQAMMMTSRPDGGGLASVLVSSDLSPSLYTQRDRADHNKNTHINIACFLACHRAASVWSLLKSPESGFKTPSCFRLAQVFSYCLDE